MKLFFGLLTLVASLPSARAAEPFMECKWGEESMFLSLYKSDESKLIDEQTAVIAKVSLKYKGRWEKETLKLEPRPASNNPWPQPNPKPNSYYEMVSPSVFFTHFELDTHPGTIRYIPRGETQMRNHYFECYEQ